MNKRELAGIVTQTKELRATLKRLANDRDLEKFIARIRRPGWTTPAEFVLVKGVLESTLQQAKTASRLKQVLLSGAEKVELNPQPLPPKIR